MTIFLLSKPSSILHLSSFFLYCLSFVIFLIPSFPSWFSINSFLNFHRFSFSLSLFFPSVYLLSSFITFLPSVRALGWSGQQGGLGVLPGGAVKCYRGLVSTNGGRYCVCGGLGREVAGHPASCLVNGYLREYYLAPPWPPAVVSASLSSPAAAPPSVCSSITFSWVRVHEWPRFFSFFLFRLPVF